MGITGSAVTSGVHGCQVTSTAASVGPYRFSNRPGHVARQRATRGPGSASPLHTITRTRSQAGSPPDVTNASSIAGTKCSTVTPARWITSARYAGSFCPPGLATTSVAPVPSGRKSSHTETSKLLEVFCSTRSAAEDLEQLRRLRSEEHTSELQSQSNIVCRLLLEKKKTIIH